MTTRREALIRFGLMASAPLLAPVSFRALAQAAATSTDGPFQKRLPRIPELKPTRSDRYAEYYLLTARAGQASILPGLATPVWGFNGQYPGPTLRAKSGRRTVVRHINQLPEPIAVHLHGGHVPADMDGHPTDLILPGRHRDYVYPNHQPAATLWYHDHAMDVTGPHVYRGLAGFYLIEGEFEQRLRLPRGRHDVPIVIQDRLINPDGSFDYTLTDMVRIEGLLGDRVLANGAIQPYFPVQRRAYRLRF